VSTGPAGRVIFAGFDGLRAIAALLVVLVHASFTAGFSTHTAAGGGYSSRWGAYTARGEIGVAVFFLISGFLLYRPFVTAHMSGRRPPALGGYLIRRAARIVPLFWVALAVTVVLEGRHSVNGVAGFLQCAFFLQAYRDHWALQGVTQAWTLDIEVAFYLTLPIWAWLVGRRARSPERQLRVELGSLAGLYLVSVALHALLATQTSGWAAAWHGWLPVWWDLFALGMALATLSTWYADRGRTPRWATLPGSATACWVVALGFYWLVSTHLGFSRSPLHGRTVRSDLAEHFFYGLFALFLLMPAVFVPARRGWVQRLLCSRPMAFLGLVSYGIYLWHQLVIGQLVKHTSWREFQIPVVEFVLVAGAVTVLVSAVTYAVVERPFIARSHDWARRWRERAAGIGSATPSSRDPGSPAGPPVGAAVGPAGTETATPDGR
jgi:peptidoglycan/LPS O-acetylase OafA/YrhL